MVLRSASTLESRCPQGVVRSAVPASLMRYLRRSAERLQGAMGAAAAAGTRLPDASPPAAEAAQAGPAGAHAVMAAAAEKLRVLRQRGAVRAIVQMGDYIESLGPIIHVSWPRAKPSAHLCCSIMFQALRTS